ncbi:hypothetical protein P7266_1847 [Lactococcus cremoris]|nr:hypothetical protein P7266_1847 [Lactococcus cremoris]
MTLLSVLYYFYFPFIRKEFADKTVSNLPLLFIHSIDHF